MENQVITTSEAASKDKEKWKEYILSEQQKTPERIENAAKAIAVILSITLTLLVSLLTDAKDVLKLCSYKLVVILWLVSVILAFFVLFPFLYRYSSISIDTFKRSLKISIRIKYIMLILSVVLYLSGMFLLGFDILNR